MTEPNLVNSRLSQIILVGINEIRIDIYKLEHETRWCLELVNDEGTSVVWDDTFPSDQAAFNEAEKAMSTEGLVLFGDSENVVQFPKQ